MNVNGLHGQQGAKSGADEIHAGAGVLLFLESGKGENERGGLV